MLVWVIIKMKNAFLILLLALTVSTAPPPVNYPVRFTYINTIDSWASQSIILAGLGVPGYAKPHIYNYIAFAFWSFSGPLDMAKVWGDPVKYIGASADLGSTKDQIQKSIKKKYNDAGISVFVSAFGATQMPTRQDPASVASALASWVSDNNLDGVDIDYEDNDAMSQSTAQQWLIVFHKKLRQLLPNHLISHAPQAPYFSTTQYRGGGYITVNNQVGSTIDFYNIQFYNQGGTTYDSYDTLFRKSNGWSTGTSVKQIIDSGVPMNKVVVGKPATQNDASNTGTVSTIDLGNWCVRAYQEFNWAAGVMFWQYKSDADGTLMNNAASALMKAANITPIPIDNTIPDNTITPPAPTPTPTPIIPPAPPAPTPTPIDNTIVPVVDPTVVIPANQKINYPIRFIYVDFLNGWWPATTIAAGMGVPGYAPPHTYNYIALAFWTYNGGVDIAKIWSNPTMFMGTDSTFGSTDNAIRTSLKAAYNNNGIKVLVSAFGATEMPTNKDPLDVALKLAKFVLDYNLDGCDIDYEDNAAMEAGIAEAWLISLTRKLRQLLPTHIITHAPQAPYFKQEYYPKGGYVTVDKQVGSLIDFYNVQFYNQGNTQYNSYQQLFVRASGFFSGTSVSQIINRGIPSNKIVVGKPVSQSDVMNTGLVNSNDLGAWTARAYGQLGWYAGVMFWQYKSDTSGVAVTASTSALISQYMVGSKVSKPAPSPNTNTTTNTTTTTTNKTTTTTTNGTKNTTSSTTNTSTIVPTANTTTNKTTSTTNTSSTNTTKTTNTTTTATNTSSTNKITPVRAEGSTVSYPVRFVYIDYINTWWPATAIAAAIGVPGYAKKHTYNYIALAFWSDAGALDIANIWSKPTYFFGTDSIFGPTDDVIRTNLKNAYNSAGIRVLVSAYGSTEFPTGKDPIDQANKLANFVLTYNFDGCDIDYEDNNAMQTGRGQAWLIAFTRRLRQLLPTQTITHAPQAPYFKNEYYPKGGYYTVDKEVGNLIDFYNVQFYNQGDTKYNTYEELFIRSSGFFSNTSVKQIVARGIPANKIVVGKPAAQIDVMNTGLVSMTDLGTWTTRAFNQLGWYAGVMLWQYRSDTSGDSIAKATSQLVSLYSSAGLPTNPPQLSKPVSAASPNLIIPQNKISYPIRFSWVNSLYSWWPAQSLLASLAVPGVAKQSLYNYVSYSLWTYELGPTGAAAIWDDPVTYLGTDSGFGSTKTQIQTNIIKRFHSLDIKLLVTAFGVFQKPTTKGINPLLCAKKLAKFVLLNKLDGVDINYQDDFAIASGTAELWLAAFSKQLRIELPNSIISHSIKPAFFKRKDKGYNQVHKEVGSTIDFYNILYMQDNNKVYNQYEQIFGSKEEKIGVDSSMSIKSLNQSGIPLYKIVAGKAILRGDLSTNGWLKPQDFGQWGMRAFRQQGWFGGFAIWEYSNDRDGSTVLAVAAELTNKFADAKLAKK